MTPHDTILNGIMNHWDRKKWPQHQHDMTHFQLPWQHNWNIDRLPVNRTASLLSLHNSQALKIDRGWQQRGKVQQTDTQILVENEEAVSPLRDTSDFQPPEGMKCARTWLAFVRARGNCRSTTRSNSACVHMDFSQRCLPFSQHTATPLTDSTVSLFACRLQNLFDDSKKRSMQTELFDLLKKYKNDQKTFISCWGFFHYHLYSNTCTPEYVFKMHAAWQYWATAWVSHICF